MYLYKYAAEKWPGKKFNEEQLNVLLRGSAASLYKVQLDLIAKPGFDVEFMKQLINGYSEGLSYEQIKILANPEFSAGFVSDVISMMNLGCSFDKALLEVNYPTPSDDWKKNENHRFLSKYEQMQLEQDYKSKMQKKINADKEFKDTFLSKTFDKRELNPVQKAVLIEGRKNGIPLDVLKIVGRPELNEWQMKQLLQSAGEGIPLEQIGFLARPEFNPQFIQKVTSRIHQGDMFFDALLEANHPTPPTYTHSSDMKLFYKREADQAFKKIYFPDMDTLRQCVKIERILAELNKKLSDFYFQPSYSSPHHLAVDENIIKMKEQSCLLEKALQSAYKGIDKTSSHKVFYENKNFEGFFSEIEKIPVERKISSKMSNYGLCDKPRDELYKQEEGSSYKRSLNSMMTSASQRIKLGDPADHRPVIDKGRTL